MFRGMGSIRFSRQAEMNLDACKQNTNRRLL